MKCPESASHKHCYHEDSDCCCWCGKLIPNDGNIGDSRFVPLIVRPVKRGDPTRKESTLLR